MLSKTVLPVLLALPWALACRAPAPAPVAPGYTLVLLKTGPMSGKLPAEENQQAFAGHFANMERMAHERQLLVAGPYGETRHDPALRGLFVLDTAERAEARAWAGTDPTTRAGVFVLEYHELEVEVPLEIALEADLARLAEQRSAGDDPQPGEGARPYVILIAEQAERAREELAPLNTAEGGVFVLGRLDGGKAWAVLDAKDVAEARERFAPQLEHLGACTLDDWFASDRLTILVR